MTTNQDAALAGALAVLELIDTSPGTQKTELLTKITQIIELAIQEAERLRDVTYEPSVN